jgi:hypothetical protein
MQHETKRLSAFHSGLLIYVFTVVLGYILFPLAWGLTNGLFVAPGIASDPKFQTALSQLLTKEELDSLDTTNVLELLSRTEKLSTSKRLSIKALTEEHLRRVNWLPIHLLSNSILFGILGFVLGLFRVQRYAVIVPLVLLPATLTVLTAEQFAVQTPWLTVAIGLTTQILAAIGFSRVGAMLRRREPAIKGPKR